MAANWPDWPVRWGSPKRRAAAMCQRLSDHLNTSSRWVKSGQSSVFVVSRARSLNALRVRFLAASRKACGLQSEYRSIWTCRFYAVRYGTRNGLKFYILEGLQMRLHYVSSSWFRVQPLETNGATKYLPSSSGSSRSRLFIGIPKAMGAGARGRGKSFPRMRVTRSHCPRVHWLGRL